MTTFRTKRPYRVFIVAAFFDGHRNLVIPPRAIVFSDPRFHPIWNMRGGGSAQYSTDDVEEIDFLREYAYWKPDIEEIITEYSPPWPPSTPTTQRAVTE